MNGLLLINSTMESSDLLTNLLNFPAFYFQLFIYVLGTETLIINYWRHLWHFQVLFNYKINREDYVYTVLPRSIAPCFIAKLAYRQNSRLSRFPPLKIPLYTTKLSYCHPPHVFRHKSRKTNLNSPVSTAHNYLLTAVYWSVIMECQNWSSETVIDLIVEGLNRWSVVLIRIISCIYFSSDYIYTFNPE
jgi:hypothetical protein